MNKPKLRELLTDEEIDEKCMYPSDAFLSGAEYVLDNHAKPLHEALEIAVEALEKSCDTSEHEFGTKCKPCEAIAKIRALELLEEK